MAGTASKRDELQHQIRQLGAKRGEYLKQKVQADGGADESLDDKVYSAIREQAGEKGLVYADGPQH